MVLIIWLVLGLLWGLLLRGLLLWGLLLTLLMVGHFLRGRRKPDRARAVMTVCMMGAYLCAAAVVGLALPTVPTTVPTRSYSASG